MSVRGLELVTADRARFHFKQRAQRWRTTAADPPCGLRNMPVAGLSSDCRASAAAAAQSGACRRRQSSPTNRLAPVRVRALALGPDTRTSLHHGWLRESNLAAPPNAYLRSVSVPSAAIDCRFYTLGCGLDQRGERPVPLYEGPCRVPDASAASSWRDASRYSMRI